MNAWLLNSLHHYAKEMRARQRKSEVRAARWRARATRPEITSACERLASLAGAAAALYERAITDEEMGRRR